MTKFDDSDALTYDPIDELIEKLNAEMNVDGEYIEIFQSNLLYARLFHEYALDGVVLTQGEIAETLEMMDDVNIEETLPVEKVGKTQPQTKILLPDNFHHIVFLKEAFKIVDKYSQDDEFMPNLAVIRDFHRLLSKHMIDVNHGAFRKEIPIHRTYFHTIAQPEEILIEMTELLGRISTRNFSTLHPIFQSSVIHQGIIQIFPFKEFSGIIGRLIGNIYLQRAGYLPVIIHASDRQAYFEALKEGERALHGIIISSMENSMLSSLKYLEELRPRRVVQW